MAHEARRWLEYAENDLAVAKHLMATFYPKPLEIVCYYCQQAAEKAVKAVYVALDIPGGVPKKHDLSFLLAQMRRCVPVAEDMLDHADELNAFGVLVRYPNEIRIDEAATAASIRYADEILAWAETQMKRLADSNRV